MKITKIYLTLGLIFFLFFGQKNVITGQTNPVFLHGREVYFRFNCPSKSALNRLTKIISIDHRDGRGDVFAYANPKGFTAFQKTGYEYTILKHPGTVGNPKMRDEASVKDIAEWDFYPTYDAYIALMNQFAADYPAICEVFSIGQSVEGRELMVARISSNVGVEQGKPQFLYTSTMHGNETAGYVLSLHLIDYLLSNYGTDDRITNLVDGIDIWINPLANPDGTYASGNHTVMGSTRTNANGIDLNRNYPDPQDGDHPDGNEYQPETMAFMQMADDNDFVMSSNWHSGTSVANYPWDTWEKLHADDSWWHLVTREWADTAQANAPAGYFTALDNGITNGYQWYEVNGGRQDFMNYFHHCREFTLEISGEFVLPADQLPDYWEYNYRSFLNYMEQVLYGIHGTVTDAVTNEPLAAKIFIENHDKDGSWVFSSGTTGKYFRPVDAGTYSVTYSADCHEPVTIEGITVANYLAVTEDVQLQPVSEAVDFTASKQIVQVDTAVDFYGNVCGNPVAYNWTFEGGVPATSTAPNPSGIVYPEEGIYDVTLQIVYESDTVTTTKEDYISVSEFFMMDNSSITTCSGRFFDSGGIDGGYNNNENYVMTIFPETEGGKISAAFVSFDVESHDDCDYDWLKIYNGADTLSELVGIYCGNNSPGTVIADNPAGALTFSFFSDYIVHKQGWEALISCTGSVPEANFDADTTQIAENDTVRFNDLSANFPTEWAWAFPGGTPEVSNEQNPVVVYENEGVYDVSLIVANGFGADTVTFSNYITVANVTGIQDFVGAEITVFPNPTSSKIFVESNTPIITVEILNVEGKRLVERVLNKNKGQIDVASMSAGVYFMRITTKDGVYVRKMMR